MLDTGIDLGKDFDHVKIGAVNLVSIIQLSRSFEVHMGLKLGKNGLVKDLKNLKSLYHLMEKSFSWAG